MILSYKAVGTFDRISAGDVVLLVCRASFIGVDLLFVSWLEVVAGRESLGLVVFTTDDDDRVKPVDWFGDCREVDLIIS
jgi:hypothetical protein